MRTKYLRGDIQQTFCISSPVLYGRAYTLSKRSSGLEAFGVLRVLLSLLGKVCCDLLIKLVDELAQSFVLLRHLLAPQNMCLQTIAPGKALGKTNPPGFLATDDHAAFYHLLIYVFKTDGLYREGQTELTSHATRLNRPR